MTDKIEGLAQAIFNSRYTTGDSWTDFTPECRAGWCEEAKAVEHALKLAGYAIVPIKPTEAMKHDGEILARGAFPGTDCSERVWRAMIVAEGLEQPALKEE